MVVRTIPGKPAAAGESVKFIHTSLSECSDITQTFPGGVTVNTAGGPNGLPWFHFYGDNSENFPTIDHATPPTNVREHVLGFPTTPSWFGNGTGATGTGQKIWRCLALDRNDVDPHRNGPVDFLP